MSEDFERMSIEEGEEEFDYPQKVANEPKLAIMYLTIFFQSITFTIVLPSLWFYIKDVKQNF